MLSRYPPPRLLDHKPVPLLEQFGDDIDYQSLELLRHIHYLSTQEL